MPAVKLTPESIVIIRSSHAGGMSIKRIARLYEISYEHARRIVRGERYVKQMQREKDRATHSRLLQGL